MRIAEKLDVVRIGGEKKPYYQIMIVGLVLVSGVSRTSLHH